MTHEQAPQALRAWMDARRETQVSLDPKASVDRRTIGRALRGDPTVTSETWGKLAVALGLDKMALINGVMPDTAVPRGAIDPKEFESLRETVYQLRAQLDVLTRLVSSLSTKPEPS